MTIHSLVNAPNSKGAAKAKIVQYHGKTGGAFNDRKTSSSGEKYVPATVSLITHHGVD